MMFIFQLGDFLRSNPVIFSRGVSPPFFVHQGTRPRSQASSITSRSEPSDVSLESGSDSGPWVKGER